MYNQRLLRSKEQLKKQLMFNFYRKSQHHQSPKQPEIHNQCTQQKSSEKWKQSQTNYHSDLQEFKNLSNVANENMQNQSNCVCELVMVNQCEWEDSHCRYDSRASLQEVKKNFYASNTKYSILQQFSRSPYREGETALQKTRNVNEFTRVPMASIIMEAPRTKEAMVQTQSEPERSRHTLLQERTPAKSQGSKYEQSLVDVSGNISQIAYLQDKLNSPYTSDNAVKSNQKEANGTQWQPLFQTFNADDKRWEKQRQETEENHGVVPKARRQVKIVKKSVQNRDQDECLQSKFQKINKEADRLFFTAQPTDMHGSLEDKQEESRSSQKIQSVLRKESSIKELIIKKQAQSQATDESAAGKRQQGNVQPDQINFKKRVSWNSCDESQIIKMLPDYDSSSNGLEAVLEDQLEDLEDSVAQSSTGKLLVTQKSQQLKKVSGSEQHTEQKCQPLNSLANTQQMNKKDLIEQFREFKPLQEIYNPQKLQSESVQSFKSENMSYSCLEDLQDVSQIKKVRQISKLFSDQKPQNMTVKQLTQGLQSSQDSHVIEAENLSQEMMQQNNINRSQFSGFSEQQGPQEQQEQNDRLRYARVESQLTNLQKMMVKDIQQQVQSLKHKMESDCNNNKKQKQAGEGAQRQGCLKWQTLHNNKKRSESVSQGSEGASQSSHDILNLFDGSHSSIDFTQILNPIVDLRDRILSETSS